MKSVDDLKRLFGVREDQELADIFKRSPGAVSNWRKTGVPASIERRADELLKERGEIPQTQTVSEQLEGLSPEIKLLADYLEVKLKGKTAEERLKYVEEVMEEIRRKNK